jgi:hypothetical protein
MSKIDIAFYFVDTAIIVYALYELVRFLIKKYNKKRG